RGVSRTANHVPNHDRHPLAAVGRAVVSTVMFCRCAHYLAIVRRLPHPGKHDIVARRRRDRPTTTKHGRAAMEYDGIIVGAGHNALIRPSFKLPQPPSTDAVIMIPTAKPPLTSSRNCELANRMGRL